MTEVSVSVDLPFTPQFLYDVWTRFEDYPKWMDHLASVQRTGPRTSRWMMRRGDGELVAWDTEHTVMRPGDKIAWSSVEGDLHTYGSVTFQASGGGTRLTWRRFHGVDLKQDPDVLAGRLADPKAKLQQDVASFKAYVTGLGRTGPPAPVRGGPASGAASGRISV